MTTPEEKQKALDILFAKSRKPAEKAVWHTTEERIKFCCDAFGMTEEEVRRRLEE